MVTVAKTLGTVLVDGQIRRWKRSGAQWLATVPPGVHDVYLDDERDTPAGWFRCWHVWQVVALLKAGRVRKLSLDHDLGEPDAGQREQSGYDLVRWMVENCRWSREKPTVHSANPVGSEAMRFLIDKWFGVPYRLENR